jgi:hypothetical protein
MTPKRLLLYAIVALFVLSACAPAATRLVDEVTGNTSDYYYGNDGAVPPGGGESGVPESEPLPADYDAVKGVAAEAPALGSSVSQAAADRLVIRNANLSLLVADPVQANAAIAQLAASLNGFVVSSSVYQASTDAQGNKIMQASITIRVPSEQLDGALTQIRGLAVEVQTESITGQDVTAEFTDLSSRLRNLEATEAQLVNIMDSATKTEEVLAVFNQLTYIREQIEQVKGQMKYYSESAAMSAVTVQLIPDVLAQPIEVGGWKPQGIAKEAIEALVRAFQGLATGLIWIGLYALPLLLILGLPLYLVARLIARRVRKPRPSAPAAQA